MKLTCGTCRKPKHDTAFELKGYELYLRKCKDCKNPSIWNKAKEFIKDFIK